jgi:hypothetical protein
MNTVPHSFMHFVRNDTDRSVQPRQPSYEPTRQNVSLASSNRRGARGELKLQPTPDWLTTHFISSIFAAFQCMENYYTTQVRQKALHFSFIKVLAEPKRLT